MRREFPRSRSSRSFVAALESSFSRGLPPCGDDTGTLDPRQKRKSIVHYDAAVCPSIPTKVYYDWQTWPMMQTYTASSADYGFADQRACMDGDLAPHFAGKLAYNGHTYAGDIASGNLNMILWGCIGLHYSGSWYDGDSTSGAVSYTNALQQTAAQKPWKTRWPSVNWPD